jgi:hypothetical protein
MQIGIDSFAAAFDDTSRAVSPQDRLQQLVEQIVDVDQAALDSFGAVRQGNATPASKTTTSR